MTLDRINAEIDAIARDLDAQHARNLIAIAKLKALAEKAKQVAWGAPK